jgi:hypothetical protein
MSILDDVYNYYERLVLEEVAEQVKNKPMDEDLIVDVVCVALNELPCRYFRYGVDMAFYLSGDEYLAMRERTRQAVVVAIERVGSRQRKEE